MIVNTVARRRLDPPVAVALFLVIAFCMTMTARATSIPHTNVFEAGMDAVFSQAAFGGNNIDIRFNPVVTLNNASLLSIDSLAELTALIGSVAVPANTATMYFVDAINFCDGPEVVGGCAEVTGDDMLIDIDFASANLNSHELGHNLGLGHVATNGRLMDPNITGTLLIAGEVTTINANGAGIIQTEVGGQRFVSITPVHVTPEPVGAALMSLGLLGLLAIRRRCRRSPA